MNLAKETSPKNAVAWLKKVLKLKRAKGLVIQPVWGANITEPIRLGKNIEILPTSKLPESPQLQRISQFQLGQQMRPYAWQPPSSAIVRRHTIEPVIIPVDVQGELGGGYDRTLDEVRLCLSLVGPCPIIPAIRWFQFTNPTLVPLNSAIGQYIYHHQELEPMSLPEVDQWDAQKVRKLVSSYLRLSGEDLTRVKRALDRFDRSMKRHTHGDTALELAIALEALLGDETTELKWRVSLRSALLAAGPIKDRMYRRAVVGALYDIRSHVAHTGEANKKQSVKGQGKINTGEVIKMGTKVVSEVISSAITRGSLPNWFREELTPPMASS